MHGSPEDFLSKAAKLDPIIFAEANLKNESGRSLEFREEHAFQVQYVRDFSPKLCVIKSSQVGATVDSILKVLFLSHINDSEIWARLFGRTNGAQGISTIYSMPSANDVSDFSATRFKPMISSSRMLVEMMGGKQGVNAVTRKTIGKSTIYFRGTMKEGQAITVPADLIVNDELDFSDPSVIEVFDSRLSASDLKWWWKFSTPTIPNYGVDAEYKLSNQYHFFIRCQHCNRRQEVKYPRNVRHKKIRGKRSRYWGCWKCDKELDRTKGFWEAKFPNREYHGYKIPPTICPWIQPDNIEDSKKRYKKVKSFHNFALGEAYSTGEDVLGRELMLSRMTVGRPLNPILDRQIFMGVDQGDVMHYVISRGIGNRRELLKVGTCHAFERIASLMVEWNVTRCIMDALPNKVPASNLAKEHYGRLLIAFYKDFDEEADMKPSPTNKYGVNLDRTNTLDMSAASWREGESVFIMDHPSMLNILDDPTNKDAFVQQMGNMTRDEQENQKTMKSRAVWLRTGPDHYRHADNYNYMAWLATRGGDIAELKMVENRVMTAGIGERLVIPGTRSSLRTMF